MSSAEFSETKHLERSLVLALKVIKYLYEFFLKYKKIAFSIF